MKTLSTSLPIYLYIYVLQNVLHLCMPRIELYLRTAYSETVACAAGCSA